MSTLNPPPRNQSHLPEGSRSSSWLVQSIPCTYISILTPTIRVICTNVGNITGFLGECIVLEGDTDPNHTTSWSGNSTVYYIDTLHPKTSTLGPFNSATSPVIVRTLLPSINSFRKKRVRFNLKVECLGFRVNIRVKGARSGHYLGNVACL